MRALVYHGPGAKSWESVADPTIQDPTDIVVRVDATTICGSDLHILKGDVPSIPAGRVLGHEAVGTVVATGAGVAGLREGDRVLVPAITSCGRCSYCRRGSFSHCLAVGGVGWTLGNTVHGTQAEYVRVLFGETSVHKIPTTVTDEQVLFLADILPTGFEVGVRNGRVKPGDVVAVVGSGPVGLAAIMTAKLAGPRTVIAIDVADSRLERALALGADVAVNSATQDVASVIAGLTEEGLGVDVAMEAVGIPETFDTCLRLVRPGGTVANIGVHGAPTTLHLEDLWIRNITITTGLVDTDTIPTLLRLVEADKLRPQAFATHRFVLDDMEKAYETFADAGSNQALKVVLTR